MARRVKTAWTSRWAVASRGQACGQKIAYVVDLAYEERNIENVVALARDADQLFIETPFLDVDANIAAGRWHLTARQAGEIAKRAHVSRLIPFHFSARYRDRADELTREAEEAFRMSEPLPDYFSKLKPMT